MSREFERSPASSLEAVSEITRTSLLLREAFMQSRREELLAIYETYVESPGAVEKPKFNVLLFGFQEAWRAGDYQRIVTVGDKIPLDYLLRWREAQAYYAMALARVGREKLRLT